MFGQHLYLGHSVLQAWRGAAELMDVTSLSGLFLVLCSHAAGWTEPHFLSLSL